MSATILSSLSLLIANYLESSSSHGIQLCVASPTLQFSDAVGFTERGENPEREVITVRHPMRIYFGLAPNIELIQIKQGSE